MATDDSPVLIAKGVDEHRIYFEEKGLREKFNFISGTQSLVNAWKRIGHTGQAAQWKDELSFLLSYTEQKTHGYSVDNSLNRISDSHNKNAELYFNAAKERLITSITKCSENLLDLL